MGVLDSLGGVGRLLWGVLSLSYVLHHGDVAVPTVNGVGDGLQSAVREGDVVLAVGEVSVPVLLGSEIVVGVIILHGILPVVDSGHVSVLVNVRLVSHGGLGAGL